ncbi:response regulator transcription factor [Marinilactibacillus psychrotolerans]|uniref:Two-component system response regulator n=1 Tax=Marinilactibacillus psychrotolerans TaxID=191770 RepID=A0AAV3WPX6_9LACT|nr:response regulator transcription factor [Marinilactibacillus psychrotolerans]GEL66774.1 DNA-binding response regulator [Marinilactibacillus psychrotolerans]GEQ35779.1 two-component system response regulator [Marinilactibacillus psychrotolerans]SDC33793.1 two component transcriptional regulator, LytTR family [Marinilactibacillus psychrotolerans]
MTYPIIICEDQLIQLQQIETIIQNFTLFHSDLFQISLKTQSPDEVENYLKKFKPKQGIYFLDIDLNHTITGIDLAEKIRAQDVQAKIIFITTHDEMIPLTIKRRVETLGFVIKDQPLDNYRSEIVDLLLLAQKRIDEAKISLNQAFIFSIGSQTFTLDLQDIYFLESSKLPHRLSLYTKNGQYEFYGKLVELEKKYPTLFKINRSCLVNLINAKEINFKKRAVYFESDLVRNFALGKAKLIKEKLK